MNVVRASWRERDPRQEEILIAKMRGAYTIHQDIVVRNLSSRGLGARARDCPPGIGEMVAVRISVLPEKTAIVKWVRGDQFGLHFQAPFVASELESILSRHQPVRPGFQTLL